MSKLNKYLITGASGFVAKHFVDMLLIKESQSAILGIDKNPPVDGREMDFQVCNLLDAKAVTQVVSGFRPTRILHLASVSSVAESWKFPVESFNNNSNVFLNLVEAVRALGLKTRILSVGSSEEYGQVDSKDLPLTEEQRLKPSSPYAVARVAQENLSKVFVDGFGADIVMTRSFNHIGPGQMDKFVIPSFVRQLVSAKKQKKEKCAILAGNTKVVRDFLDVRDVVSAYWSLFEKGKSGQVYNICSGQGRSLDSILNDLSVLLEIPVDVQEDPRLLRPNELQEIVGCPRKIQREIGWLASIPFAQSLRDLIEYWERTVE